MLTADSSHELLALYTQLDQLGSLAEMRQAVPAIIRELLRVEYVSLALVRDDGTVRYGVSAVGNLDAFTGDMEQRIRQVLQSTEDMDMQSPSPVIRALKLSVRQQVLGALYVARPIDFSYFTLSQETLLQLIGMQLAAKIETLTLRRDLEEDVRATATTLSVNDSTNTLTPFIHALEDTAQALTSQQPLEAVLDRILANIGDAIESDAVNIMLLEEDLMRVVRARGYAAFGVDHWIIQMEQTLEEFPLSMRVLETGDSLIVSDTQKHPDWRYIKESAWIRSHAKVVMRIGGEIIGLVNLDSAKPGNFNDSDIQALQIFANQAAVAIHIARLVERERERAQVEESLRQIAQSLNQTLDIGEVFSRIIGNLGKIADCDTASVQVLTDTDLEIVACDGFDNPQEIIGQRFSIIDNILVNQLASSKQAVQIPDARLHPTFTDYFKRYPDIEFRTWLGVPFIVNGKFVGQFTLDRNEVRPFTDEEIQRAITFANHAAIALENAQLHTQLQQRAEDREQNWSQAVESNRIRTQLITNVAHDIRSPLSTVYTSLIMLRDGVFGALTKEQREWLQSSISSVDLVMRLSQDFFDLTKSEMGQLNIYSDEVELSIYLQRIARLGRALPWGDEVSFETDIPDGLPIITLDKTRIQQVMMNLLYNALKFTEAGTVRFYARHEDEADVVRIGVEDTGIGIPAGELNTIFERFKQVGSNRQRQQGTGIGLAVCKELVHLHGGELYVTSEMGVGSDFYFTLPLKAAPLVERK